MIEKIRIKYNYELLTKYCENNKVELLCDYSQEKITKKN